MIKASKQLFIFFILIVHSTAYCQTTATAASPVDCSGVTHDLFTQLDAGKIIVIGWTMPCASCAAPLLNVHNAVLQFTISDPGVVEYWVNDDFANTSCSSVQGWGTSNGITNAIFFSSTELSMFDYGGAGMPKVVVLGCGDHKIYYNVNDSPTAQGVRAAILSALDDLDNGCLLGIDELSYNTVEMSCYPNPTNGNLTIEFNESINENASLEIRNITGELIKLKSYTSISNLTPIQLDITLLDKGIYFINLQLENHSITKKVIVI